MSLMNSLSVPKLWNWEAFAACSNRNCLPSAFLQTLSRKRERIRIGADSYCSPECFEEGAQTHLAELCRVGAEPRPSRRFRVPLGLLLLSRGVINQDQLQEALKRQRSEEGRIGEILVRLGFASEDDVMAGVAAQWGYPVFSLRKHYLPLEIQLPGSLLARHSILPVYYTKSSRKLMIGFVNGVDHGLLSAIEAMTETETVPCFITPSEFHEKLKSLTAERESEEVSFDRVSSFLEMARIVQSYVVQVASEEARFSHCADQIWCRISGRRHTLDLLFRLPTSSGHRIARPSLHKRPLAVAPSQF